MGLVFGELQQSLGVWFVVLGQDFLGDSAAFGALPFAFSNFTESNEMYYVILFIKNHYW